VEGTRKGGKIQTRFMTGKVMLNNSRELGKCRLCRLCCWVSLYSLCWLR